jgi:hypothetical protein
VKLILEISEQQHMNSNEVLIQHNTAIVVRSLGFACEVCRRARVNKPSPARSRSTSTLRGHCNCHGYERS